MSLEDKYAEIYSEWYQLQQSIGSEWEEEVLDLIQLLKEALNEDFPDMPEDVVNAILLHDLQSMMDYLLLDWSKSFLP